MRRLTLALLGLALGACGRSETPAAPSPGAGGAGGSAGGGLPSLVKPDEAPWGDDPAGPAWDACAWAPAGEKVDLATFRVAEVRADALQRRPTEVGYDAPRVRRTWVRTLGLPEEALGTVVSLREPLRLFVCALAVPEAEVVKALLAQGLVERAGEGGLRAFGRGDDAWPLATLIDGRLVVDAEPEALATIAAVRRGARPSAQSAPGLKAVCAAAPKALPAEVDVGGMKRRRPSDPPAPLVSVGIRGTSGGRLRETHVLACASEADAGTLSGFVDRVTSQRPDVRPDDRVTLGQHGSLLRLTVDVASASDVRAARNATESLLQSLVGALATYRERHGAWPSAAQGLGALAADPDLLDEVLGAVPSDPWGRPFAYQPAHPRRPDGFVLRSLGPDGEIDTEDDVLPAERER